MKRSAIFNTVAALVFVSLGVLFISCDQEPLFWDVAHAYSPISPRINGAPSKIVEITSGTLYVSNGRVWEYSGTPPVWHVLNTAPPDIRDLAAVGSTLYALSGSGILSKTTNGVDWDTVDLTGVNGKIESIFGAGSDLFAGSLTGKPGASESNTVYSIYRYTGSWVTPAIASNTGKLTGAAVVSGVTYLGTLGTGMLASDSSYQKVSFLNDDFIMGLTFDSSNLYIITSTRVCHISGGSLASSISGTFTEAIAVWSHGTDKLLLIGVRSGSGSNGWGYREINITTGAFSSGIKVPGANPAPFSVRPDNQYTSGIGKHVVNYLWVLDITKNDSEDDETNPRPIVFASTVKNGLWSYKKRGDDPQWNGER